ncbi:hypothetical protein IST4116A_01203 [Burkholderia cenocepacia]|uniref:hypothetical protein n=1 Tax=Burkholderia cenocepacia TaxID=95486 RepID=UPI00199A855E|nr:hypothetical protein [Burkholderia cenocepacia]CAB5082936.1 hypothetical protein IST4116B_01195 [Burkholderia cenocepacia]CAB5083622.1 hypothetical protein IST4134_01204 [Burkholderia cenocepacia]CAB5087744.1 hypothetical protein IST4113_01202 [Burkholderia cenocepacia]CAB5095749.1 hypothetical protein IST439_01242 [Burkholderia cenocepacia]CAB5105155.1 hypothetical protein IST4129_01203 [Burkholderia cenocepacia]
MGQPTIQPSFAAGELSPALWSRVDLEKYHVGAALMRNMFVDFRGGVSNRAGTAMVGPCVSAATASRLIPFTFSTLQTYALLFGDHTMRVVMNGAFVLEPAFTVQAVTNANPCSIQATGNNFSNGDLVELNLPGMLIDQRLCVVQAAGGGSFTLLDTFGNPIDSTNAGAFAGGSVARVYTQATPYAAADLATLKYVQSADVMTLTHPSYVPYQLTRTQHWVWTFTAITFQSKTAAPVGVTAQSNMAPATFSIQSATAANPAVFSSTGNDLANGDNVYINPVSGSGWAPIAGTVFTVTNAKTDGTFWLLNSAGVPLDGSSYGTWTTGSVSHVPTQYQYVVTAIGANGTTESLPSAVASCSGATLSRVAGARNTITIPAQSGPTMYTIYRTAENAGGSPPAGALFGFIGSVTAQSSTMTFVDNNITPDFTNCPPQGNNPFVNGNYPACSTYFQQRQVFGGLANQPDGLSLSKSGDFLNMDYSSPSKADDSIQVTIASQQVNAIKHLLPMTSLIALTASGAWRVDGGSQSSVITPSQFDAVPQAYNGCSDVPPIVINYDILYVQSKGATVRDLSYNFYVNIYTGTDMTVLSKHLFDGHQIVEWAYAEEPYKVIWAVREDGVLLSFTYIKEQDVYAWARHDTNGLFKSVCSISEGNENAVYFVVERMINGQLVQYVERMASRILGGDPSIGEQADLTKAWFVDSGRQYPLSYPSATLYPQAMSAPRGVYAVNVVNGGQNYTNPTIVDSNGSGATFSATVAGGVITAIAATTPGVVTGRTNLVISDPTGSGAVATAIVQARVTMNASAPVFGAQHVGAVLRASSGMGTVVSVPSATQIIVNVTTNLLSIWPSSAGSWSLTIPVSTVRGLDHLNGQTVAILADGNVLPQQTVVNGTVTLPRPATSIVVGLPYQSQLKTLYLDVQGGPTIQSKRRKVSAVTVRMLNSRGMKIGQTFDMLHEFKERNTQPMGQPIQLITGDERITLDPLYDLMGQVCVQQDDPLPCTVLGVIPEVTVGDN